MTAAAETAESDASVARFQAEFEQRGFGWWAVEVRDTLGLPEILAVTTATNTRSQAVMRRLGMTRNPADDFDDPTAPEGPLRPSVLYRITRN